MIGRPNGLHRLTISWLILMVMTALSLITAIGGLEASGPYATMTLIVVVTWIKVRLVLKNYLELHLAPAWLGLLSGLIGTLVIVTAVLSLL
ncbi:hypothetical protein [Coralliovum pocilloporae]|uniref:hypothetical protein n=1 Tax=Coralliovum pocilloporae TaxID=3066369 RepID=UPI003306D719